MIRYAFNDEDIHAQLTDYGFKPVDYQPSERKLYSLEHYHDIGNTLYVRRPVELDQRLREVRPAKWNLITYETKPSFRATRLLGRILGH